MLRHISRAEFSRALQMLGLAERLSEGDATQLMSALDVSGDGRVDWPEFVSFLLGFEEGAADEGE